MLIILFCWACFVKLLFKMFAHHPAAFLDYFLEVPVTEG